MFADRYFLFIELMEFKSYTIECLKRIDCDTGKVTKMRREKKNTNRHKNKKQNSNYIQRLFNKSFKIYHC